MGTHWEYMRYIKTNYGFQQFGYLASMTYGLFNLHPIVVCTYYGEKGKHI